MPRPLLQRPKLKWQDQAYLAFYQTLDNARCMGMSSPNPIQLTELTALCQLMGIASQTDKSKYLRIVQQLDQVYRNHWAEANKNNK